MTYSTQWFHGSKVAWTLEWRWSASFQSYFLSMWEKRNAAFSPPFFFFLSEYLPRWQSNLFSAKKLDAGVSFGARKWVCGDEGQVEGTSWEEQQGEGCLISRPRLGNPRPLITSWGIRHLSSCLLRYIPRSMLLLTVFAWWIQVSWAILPGTYIQMENCYQVRTLVSSVPLFPTLRICEDDFAAMPFVMKVTAPVLVQDNIVKHIKLML